MRSRNNNASVQLNEKEMEEKNGTIYKNNKA